MRYYLYCSLLQSKNPCGCPLPFTNIVVASLPRWWLLHSDHTSSSMGMELCCVWFCGSVKTHVHLLGDWYNNSIQCIISRLARCYNVSLTASLAALSQPCPSVCVCGKNKKVTDYPIVQNRCLRRWLANFMSLSSLDVGGPTKSSFGQINRPTPRFLFRTVNIDVPIEHTSHIQ